jgi:Ca2+-binding RTX toxin-like protein
LEDEQSLNWSPQALAALGKALALWESVANIDFVEIESPFADALFWVGTQSQAGGPNVLGWSEVPGYTHHEHLNVVFNGEHPSWSVGGLAKGGIGFVTLVHEIGHLLGLAHPHDGGSAWDASTFPGVDAPFSDYGDGDLNQGIYTTMGYNSGWPVADDPTSPNWGFEAGPMALDIAAIQAIYGANTSYASGNDVYKLPTVNGAGTYWSAIWDTGGVDTISGAGWSGDATIDLRAATAGSDGGGYVSRGYTSWGELIPGGFTIARGVVIENAIGGSGHDTIIGNAVANRLEGGAGRDTLDGQSGADTMIGGAGNDAYYVENSGDVIIELDAWAETDIVYAIVSYTLSAYVEHLTLTGTASINGTGNASDNTIVGNSGDNILDGGGGVDYLYGGNGNDTYILRGNQANAIELAGGGIDTIRTDWGGKLEANFENMELLAGAWSAEGNDYDNRIVGNDGSNSLNGGLGNDTIVGGLGNDNIDGGLGADTMMGGLGGDTYYVDNPLDVVIEEDDDLSEGWDEIFVEFTYSLVGLGRVEYLNLSRAGRANIDATGNDLKNALYGSDGNNVLDGRAGADFMMGLKGNDTYIVDDLGDYVSESAGGGNDTVRSSASSFTLHDNVENLILIGTASIGSTGNALANSLIGNVGDNVLDGGAGNDTMVGGQGADTYVVDAVGDVVTEGVGAGTDTVNAWLGWTLGANLEQLRLMGTASINGTGNGLNNALFGNAGKNVLDGAAGADTMSGGLGDDTYVVDQSDDIVIETASGGTDLVQSSAGSYQLGAYLENLILTGNKSINGTGNTLVNVLTGNNANNVLDGGTGADTMAGAAGNDTYVVDNAADVVTELAGRGSDTVLSSVTWTLGTAVEKLTLTGVRNIDGTGNELANVLTGNAGKNLLDGGWGSDTMAGGLGNDTYVVDAAGDVVIEAAGEGIDLVRAGISYTLGSNVERLTLTGTANYKGTGNALSNVLQGNDGNNVLDGKAGADTMAGGLGNDTYIVDEAGDVATEAAEAGTDTVQSSVAWRLRANFEKLILSGEADINGTGNELANVLTGNGGNNVLDGGAGGDAMAGGLGNDTYIIDNSQDQVSENPGGGIDTVQSSISHTLRANIENLVLTGNAAINGNGNAEANVLTGNAANNVLDGRSGADTMIGGGGDDTYVVENAGDALVELAAGGTDTVQASISYALTANVEKLKLSGSADIDGTGNPLANTLIGNGGHNILDGGLGADTLNGAGGGDTFRFSTALGPDNVDRIVVFDHTGDTVQLDHAVFAALGTGALGAGAFNFGSVATEADDRILFHSASKSLYYDADGAGGVDAVKFATFDTLKGGLDHTDFLIV